MWVVPQYETVTNYFCVFYQIVRKLEVADCSDFIRLKWRKLLNLSIKDYHSANYSFTLKPGVVFMRVILTGDSDNTRKTYVYSEHSD